MLVATGHPRTSSTQTELFDLENPNNNCTYSGDYPISAGVSHAVGGLLAGDKPIICGGFNGSSSNIIRECYFLGSSEVVATMREPRFGAAAIVIEPQKYLWIVGDCP